MNSPGDLAQEVSKRTRAIETNSHEEYVQLDHFSLDTATELSWTTPPWLPTSAEIGMLRKHCVLIRSHRLATAGGTISGSKALSMMRCSFNGSLGFSVSRWIAHWCIGVPLTYCVLSLSHRTRTLDGALSMLRQFATMGALMLQLNHFAAHILLPVVVSTGYILTVVS